MAEGTSTLRELAEAIKRFGDERILAGVRAVLADGQGLFLLAMALFGLSAVAFHFAILPQTSRENRLVENLSKRQESLNGERYPVLAGLVTQRSTPLICGADSKRIRDTLSNLADMFDKGVVGWTRSDNETIHAVKVWNDLTGWAVSSDLPQRESEVLAPSCGENAATLGAAWTDPVSPISTLFVPSTIAWRAASAAPCDVCSGDPRCVAPAAEALNKDYGWIFGASTALDALPLANMAPIDERARVRSAYFVSLDGITRTVGVRDDGQLFQSSGAGRLSDFAPHFMNNGTSYFFDTVSPRGPNGCQRHVGSNSSTAITGYVTAPYLDTFGGGLVETFCRQVKAFPRGAEPATTSPDKLIGVFCVDIAHTEKNVLASLDRLHEVFDVSLVRIHDLDEDAAAATTKVDEGRSIDPRMDTCATLDCPPNLERNAIPSSVLKNFAALYYRNRLVVHSSLRRGGVFSDGGCVGSECLFGVTVYQGSNGPKQTYWDVAVIQLRRPQARDFVALISCGVFLLAGMFVLSIGYRKRSKARDAYFVRGFALGAVHISPTDHVIGGNDRAEAILGRDLPRIIHDGSVDTRGSTFSAFVDRARCVLLDSYGQIGPASVVSYDEIRWRCTDGLTLSFYLYLRRRGWVRATARVVMRPEQKDDMFIMLDPHVCAQHRPALEWIRATSPPVPSHLQLRRDRLDQKLTTIGTLGKIRVLYIYRELNQKWIEGWAYRSVMGVRVRRPDVEILVSGPDEVASEPVTRISLDEDRAQYQVPRTPAVWVIDPHGRVRDLAIGPSEIETFVHMRLEEMRLEARTYQPDEESAA